MPRPFAFAAIVLLILLSGLPAAAQERGGISGTVVDKKSNRAIPFATVTVVGAQKGGLTDSEGKFLVTGIPVGSYEVKVQFLGYAPVSQPGVTVVAGKSVPLRFALEEVVVREEKAIEVTAERRLVDTRQGTTVRSVNAAEIRNLPVQTITDVLQQQAGIQTDGDQVHVRGGRADETLFLVQGVANRDLVTGQPTAGQLNARSVAEVNVATGAYDVRYGNALSGVVEVRLKEGSDKFAGGFTTAGETYGGRAMQLTLGGPLGFAPGRKGTMTWFMDVSTNFQDTRFPNITMVPGAPALVSSYEDALLGRTFGYGPFWAPAEDNNWAGRGSLLWKTNNTDRWNLDFSKRISIDQGFSRTFINAAGDAGDPTYPWAWSRRIDHAPTIFEDNVQASLKYRHTISTTGFTELQISHYYSALRRDVGGKHWSEYEPPDDLSLPPFIIVGSDTIPNPERNDYFYNTGDDNTWQDRRTSTTAVHWDLTKRFHRHEVEFGFEHSWQSVQYVTIEDPWEPDPSGLGGTHDLWTVHPWVGTLFARDRIDFEGFSANIGLRADYWFVVGSSRVDLQACKLEYSIVSPK